MKIIKPSVRFLDPITPHMLKKLEYAGRVCYKSNMSDNPEKFITQILEGRHESVIEHVTVTTEIICDRGVTHEWVRHRLASYSQESTRYCNYSLDKFNNEITVIKPIFWTPNDWVTPPQNESENINLTHEQYEQWEGAMLSAEAFYFKLLSLGATPQEARSVLPNSTKTTLVDTMNLREWRHFFKLRCALDAHPQMREVAVPLLEMFQESCIGFMFNIEKFGAKDNYTKEQIEFGKFDYVKDYSTL